MKNEQSAESFAIKNGVAGDRFFTSKPDKSMTATAVYYKRKIATERCICITGSMSEPKVETITRVTLL
jgi:hypothetical protein